VGVGAKIQWAGVHRHHEWVTVALRGGSNVGSAVMVYGGI
jgi:hypothetical protein